MTPRRSSWFATRATGSRCSASSGRRSASSAGPSSFRAASSTRRDLDPQWERASTPPRSPRTPIAADAAALRGLAIAACREALEEAAILPIAGATPSHAELLAWRKELTGGTQTLRSLLEARGLRLDLEALHPLARWVTPIAESRRFDTRFFLYVSDAATTGAARRPRDDRELLGVTGRGPRPARVARPGAGAADASDVAGARAARAAPQRPSPSRTRRASIPSVRAWSRSTIGTGTRWPSSSLAIRSTRSARRASRAPRATCCAKGASGPRTRRRGHEGPARGPTPPHRDPDRGLLRRRPEDDPQLGRPGEDPRLAHEWPSSALPAPRRGRFPPRLRLRDPGRRCARAVRASWPSTPTGTASAGCAGS